MSQIGSNDGSFVTHTLIYELGRMAEAVLRVGHRDESFLERLREWRSAAVQCDSTRHLVSTGIGETTVFVLARDESNEFCVLIKHPRASALVPVAFDRVSSRLTAVWLAEFDGEAGPVIAFCREMARVQLLHLRQRRAAAWSPTLPLSSPPSPEMN